MLRPDQRRIMWRGRSVAALVAAIGVLAVAGRTPNRDSIHIVFTTECNNYFNWQSLAFVHSFHKVGQPGKLTRLVSCSDTDRARYKDIDVEVPTHFGPSWTYHPTSGDVYSGINKPVVVADWLNVAKPEEDYIIILDADMIMREPLDPVAMGVKPGWAVAAFFGYMKGVANELAIRHVKEVTPHNDSLAGPFGRRGDQVGGFTMMLKEDLQRMVPYWISYTEAVRADPDAWKYAGDAYATKAGDKCWISEMYGYSFGASKAGVWHHTDHSAMMYPGYMPTSLSDDPNVLHYGLLYEVEGTGYKFDKHWYKDYDGLVCPPWEINGNMGLFPHPPHPNTLKTTGLARLRDLMAIEVPATLNEALCARHFERCPESEQLRAECGKVASISGALAAELRAYGSNAPCEDLDTRCTEWYRKGECDANPAFMSAQCKMSCGLCPRKQKRKGSLLVPKREHPQQRPHVLDPNHAELIGRDGKQQEMPNGITDTQAAHVLVLQKEGLPNDLPLPLRIGDEEGTAAPERKEEGSTAPEEKEENKEEEASPETTPASKISEALTVETDALPEAEVQKRIRALRDMKASLSKTTFGMHVNVPEKAGSVSRIAALKEQCARYADLTMSQVVDCYKAAEAGKVYRQQQAPDGGNSSRGTGDRVRVQARVQTIHGADHVGRMRELHEKVAQLRAPEDDLDSGWFSRTSLGFWAWLGVMVAWLAGPLRSRRLAKATLGGSKGVDAQKHMTPRRRRTLDL